MVNSYFSRLHPRRWCPFSSHVLGLLAELCLSLMTMLAATGLVFGCFFVVVGMATYISARDDAMSYGESVCEIVGINVEKDFELGDVTLNHRLVWHLRYQETDGRTRHNATIVRAFLTEERLMELADKYPVGKLMNCFYNLREKRTVKWHVMKASAGLSRIFYGMLLMVLAPCLRLCAFGVDSWIASNFSGRSRVSRLLNGSSINLDAFTREFQRVPTSDENDDAPSSGTTEVAIDVGSEQQDGAAATEPSVAMSPSPPSIDVEHSQRKSLLSTSCGSGSGNAELERCTICLDEFECGETICELACSHRFHRHCLQQWVEYKSSCPVCVQDILEARNFRTRGTSGVDREEA